tara:strand:+ start:1409 stop:2017 length:609 start_codon:yes stop_codon:yes gene_type:complete
MSFTYVSPWPQEENIIDNSAKINWDHVKIGKGNKISPFVYIGGDAEHFREETKGYIQIGNNNTIREFVNIHRPTGLSEHTTMGNDCYIMVHSHISHDCIIEDNVQLSVRVTTSGHNHIMKGANLGHGCIIHPWQIIGSYSMIGMGTVIPKKTRVEPGYIYVGNPAKKLKLNEIGLERAGVTQDMLDIETARYNKLMDKYPYG